MIKNVCIGDSHLVEFLSLFLFAVAEYDSKCSNTSIKRLIMILAKANRHAARFLNDNLLAKWVKLFLNKCVIY